jgi:hypothetical protein
LKALEAVSTHYQGMADSQKALESFSAHYQGLADLYLGEDYVLKIFTL